MSNTATAPFFTVIIPTYNRADLISKPIESVIGQTLTSWELIVVDDGSTDNTEQVVKSFSDLRIRYIYQQNKERSAARNRGISHARGQYICFLDSDEYYLPQHLESFQKKIEKERFSEAVFYCDTYEDKDGILLKISGSEFQARNPVEWVVQLPLTVQRTCSHRNIFKKHLFNPEITIGEDIDLWVRVFKEFLVIYDEACTVVFASHPERSVDISKEGSFLSHLKLIKKIISEDKEKFISKSVRKQILSYAYLRLGYHYIHAKSRVKAINAIASSFFVNPRYRFKEKAYLLLTQIPLAGHLLKKN